jgi:hypothetical protein
MFDDLSYTLSLIANAITLVASMITLVGVMMMQRERQGEHNPED